MKKIITGIMLLMLVLSIVGCGKSGAVSLESKEVKSTEKAQNTGDIAQENDKQQSEVTSSESNEESANAAVVYFSGTGNTEAVAKTMARVLNSDIYEIVPATPYTDADLKYSDDDCRANKEQQDDTARPQIENDLSTALNAETIYLGYPIWWGTNPKIIQTFFESYDLTGKTVYTFCTSGGSGIETSVSNLQKLYPEVNIVSGHRFQTLDTEDIISEWISGLNYDSIRTPKLESV